MYRVKNNTSEAMVVSGKAKAASPNRMANIPRAANAQQLRASSPLVDGWTRLAQPDEVPITRYAKVLGKQSPLNAASRNYWELRRRRRLAETLRSPKRSALLRQQDCKCALRSVWFNPDEDTPFIDEHHDPRHLPVSRPPLSAVVRLRLYAGRCAMRRSPACEQQVRRSAASPPCSEPSARRCNAGCVWARRHSGGNRLSPVKPSRCRN